MDSRMMQGGKVTIGCHDDEGQKSIDYSVTENTPLVALSRDGIIEDESFATRTTRAEITDSERTSSSDSVVKDGALGCLRYCCRIYVPIVPILAMTILLLSMSGMTWMGDYSYPYYASLMPSTNTQKIVQLEESLGSSLEFLKNAAVATDHGECSKIGKTILTQGGNAVDAAVAATLCLGVASPASSGLGGGAFILVRMNKSDFEQRQGTVTVPDFTDARTQTEDSSNSQFMTEVIDCREVAPEKASRDMYLGLPDRASMAGGLAIAVPGELRGLELAHARHGRLPWSEVVQPAMLLARDGVPVDKHMGRFIEMFFERYLPILGGKNNPFVKGLMDYLSGWSDDYVREGDLLKNPPLAKTLQAVAENGADAFYKGSIAENLVKDVQNAGGIMTLNDMNSYKAVLRTPVSADVAGYTVYGVPPPSSGGAVVIGVLRFLSGYSHLFANDNKGLSVHRMVEGMRHAFAIRMSLSDPVYHTNVTKDAVFDLTTSGYMESLRQMTSDDTVLSLSEYGGPKWAQLSNKDGQSEAKDAHEGDRRRKLRKENTKSAENMDNQHQRRLISPLGYLEDNGTSHLSVVDSEGNAVAITSSINGIFGSLVYSESTGVILGNTMDDFGVPAEPDAYGILPSEANFIVGGKRPLSSMSPTIVLKNGGAQSSSKWGDLVLVWGGSGGPKIISSVIQVFLNVLFRNMSLFDAVTSPRVHDQLVYHGSIVTTTENMTLEGDNGPRLAIPEDIKSDLLERHHRLLDIDYTGCVQAILVDHESNTLSAVSDMRKDGSPSGY